MRSVVVTGGSRGLGLAIARRLAAAGFMVVAVARAAGPEVQEAMAAEPGLRFMACDLAEIETLHGFSRQLQDQHGPVFGLVNNAGIGTAGVLATMADGRIEALVRLNVTSPMVLTKYLLRPMLQAGAGRVVNISSILHDTGFSGLAAYGASKAALVGFTRSLAREVGPAGITVNAVAPGFVKTAMTHAMDEPAMDRIRGRSALRRLTTQDDVAATVAFLMSEGAANITGTVLTVDAGATA